MDAIPIVSRGFTEDGLSGRSSPDNLSLVSERPGFEAEVERKIREAVEAGELDDLPGAGAPIPGAGESDDPLWWVRAWVRRNQSGD